MKIQSLTRDGLYGIQRRTTVRSRFARISTPAFATELRTFACAARSTNECYDNCQNVRVILSHSDAKTSSSYSCVKSPKSALSAIELSDHFQALRDLLKFFRKNKFITSYKQTDIKLAGDATWLAGLGSSYAAVGQISSSVSPREIDTMR
jgi:hypothetical protein